MKNKQTKQDIVNEIVKSIHDKVDMLANETDWSDDDLVKSMRADLVELVSMRNSERAYIGMWVETGSDKPKIGALLDNLLDDGEAHFECSLEEFVSNSAGAYSCGDRSYEDEIGDFQLLINLLTEHVDELKKKLAGQEEDGDPPVT